MEMRRKTKMPKYRVNYFFEGVGEVIINAKNADKAKEIFYDGPFDKEREWGENYTIDKITKLCPKRKPKK